MIFVINTTESNSNLQLFSIKMEIIIKSDLIQQKKSHFKTNEPGAKKNQQRMTTNNLWALHVEKQNQNQTSGLGVLRYQFTIQLNSRLDANEFTASETIRVVISLNEQFLCLQNKQFITITLMLSHMSRALCTGRNPQNHFILRRKRLKRLDRDNAL